MARPIVTNVLEFLPLYFLFALLFVLEIKSASKMLYYLCQHNYSDRTIVAGDSAIAVIG